MAFDAAAASEALARLDIAQERLRQLIPNWPEVRTNDIVDIQVVVEGLLSVEAATYRALSVFRGG